MRTGFLELLVGLEPTTCSLRINKNTFYELSQNATNVDTEPFLRSRALMSFDENKPQTIQINPK